MGCAEISEAILSQAPQAKVLATSREPLHVSGEVVRQIPPLDPQNGMMLIMDRADQAGVKLSLMVPKLM